MYGKPPTLISCYLGTSLGYFGHIDISLLQYTPLFSTVTYCVGGKVHQHILWPLYHSRAGLWKGSIRAWRRKCKCKNTTIPMTFIPLSLSPWSIHYFGFIKMCVSISLLPFIYLCIKGIKINRHQWRTLGINNINH